MAKSRVETRKIATQLQGNDVDTSTILKDLVAKLLDWIKGLITSDKDKEAVDEIADRTTGDKTKEITQEEQQVEEKKEE